MSKSMRDQKAVNYLERRADFSALDALVSQRRNLGVSKTKAEMTRTSLPPIKVNVEVCSVPSRARTCNSALATAGSLNYFWVDKATTNLESDWFKIGSSPKSNRPPANTIEHSYSLDRVNIPASERKTKYISRNKETTDAKDRRKSHSSRDKQTTVSTEKKKKLHSSSGNKQTTIPAEKKKKLLSGGDKEMTDAKDKKKKNLPKDQEKPDSIEQEIPSFKRSDTFEQRAEQMLKRNDASLQRRLERKISRDRETRGIRRARLRSVARSMQFSPNEDPDTDLLENTDDEEHIYPYRYYADMTAEHSVANPPESISHQPISIPRASQNSIVPQYRSPYVGNVRPSVGRTTTARTDYRSCKRSLLRWMAQNMCKQPFVRH